MNAPEKGPMPQVTVGDAACSVALSPSGFNHAQMWFITDFGTIYCLTQYDTGMIVVARINLMFYIYDKYIYGNSGKFLIHNKLGVKSIIGQCYDSKHGQPFQLSRIRGQTSVATVVCSVHVDSYPSLLPQRISWRNSWMTRYGI